MAAGVATAETSISWSGTATAGVARIGKIDAGVATLTDAQINLLDGGTGGATTKGDVSTITDVAGSSITTDMTSPAFASDGAGTAAEIAAYRKANAAAIIVAAGEQALTTTEATALTNKIASIDVFRSMTVNTAGSASPATVGVGDTVFGGITLDVSSTNHDTVAEVDAILDPLRASAVEALRASAYNTNGGTAAAVAGKFQTYSEVNATVTGSVSTDNGITITAAVSVDAGTGYDFADDDGFDAAKTNGVSLDNVTIATAMGTFKIDENAVAHLVDGDDDTNADILYTNTFGSASISAAVDISEDKDPVYVAADGLNNVTLVANDVQWSAKISMPVAGGSAHIAMDEEGGNVFGASTTLSGFGLSFSSKLEAHEEEAKKDRSNTLGLTYALGTTTLGATWNSVEDGDQWGISAAYAADGMSISASTDEGSDWSVSGSMALGSGASVVGGVNYTEDAYLGLSFAF